MIKRCSHLTLLELLIAMGLTMALLTALTLFYRDVAVIDRQSAQAEKENFYIQYAENRLSQIIPMIAEIKEMEEKILFYTSNDTMGLLAPGHPSLIFTFDNGVNLNSQYGSYVIARLYLDQQKRLCLAVWPLPSKKQMEAQVIPPMYQEILLENVESLVFKFYIAPEVNRDLFATQKKMIERTNKSSMVIPLHNPANPWVSQWLREYHCLPAMMKVVVTLSKQGEKTFAFPIPASDRIIVYEDL